MGGTDRLMRLARWCDRLPKWAQPPVHGALCLIALIGLRGGLIGIPLLVVLILLKSDHVSRDLLAGAGILGMALVGGAASGIAYAVTERWVRPIPMFGRSLAGIVTVAPYMAAVTLIAHASESPHWNDPLGGFDAFVFVVCSILFGLAIAAE
jgi:hypothetical protein